MVDQCMLAHIIENMDSAVLWYRHRGMMGDLQIFLSLGAALPKSQEGKDPSGSPQIIPGGRPLLQPLYSNSCSESYIEGVSDDI